MKNGITDKRVWPAGAGLGVLVASAVHAAQPDYPGALWNSAYPGHWYTTGNGHYFVVEHDTELYYEATLSYFQQSGTEASINYCVNSLHNGSDDQGHVENNPNDAPAGEITQMVEEQYWAWHVVCWNRWMFGTEHEGFATSPAWYSDAMYQASGALTRYLCDKYNIPKDRNHIIGHDEWQNPAWVSWMTDNWPQIDTTCNTHHDPGPYWDWTKFMSIVTGSGGATAWVDFNYGGTGSGTFAAPYHTLAEGVNAIPAGGILFIKAGTSGETLTIAKVMTIQAYGGPTIIGR